MNCMNYSFSRQNNEENKKVSDEKGNRMRKRESDAVKRKKIGDK